MIRYRPQYSSISRSLKDEEIFESVEEMTAVLFDRWSRIFRFIESKSPFAIEDIEIGESIGYDNRTGWHNVRPIRIKNRYGVGFCGE